jgi:adenylate kinase
MRGFTFLVLAAVAGIGFTTITPKAEAQVNVEIGVAPDCP